ncbi:methylenetetrahydrofolate reductase (NADPH) [Ruminococcus sp. YE71]|uniref:methylenetetrahydrofolate reductase [NAD(P)H] n=1 Tax=unclassified Ruminococcus TaxID=2608920 RepID=UPI00087F0E0F|nr:MULTISPECIES: methylenetetrahydrofolate reductase [NAD(P)H] [unclassified Ruminococcus]SDA22685.1 methylenetetrahydrofolate reductase (NADPH) [Ruminococcus sp. YE78]SFW38599.1 methylenetetrahydrofolate reductase (NADPH) [Ruminococcus sp. YE71]
MKTADIFNRKKVFSLEIFPPKPSADESVIYDTLDKLTDIEPDFISVTYGAGGGKNGSKTISIASDIVSKYSTTSVAHLPCIDLTKDEAAEILDSITENGIENVLALRGDIPEGAEVKGDFRHADELVTFIRENYDLNIVGACYPEVHPESRNAVDDIRHLKHKVECGVDHLITQLFLDNRHFYDFREKTQLAGINIPIEAGIMPVTNKRQIERMVKLCGVELPKKFVKVLDRYGDDRLALRDAGIAYAVDQINDLAAEGVDGIHLYTMNDPFIAHRIFDAVHNLI